MPQAVAPPPKKSPFGSLLQHWRKQRSMSQLALALASGVSQRHVSFVESGRASPSREMILRLARVLDVPFRHQNLLLSAGGFAPCFSEADLSDPALAQVRTALDFMLRQQEPYPASVIDRGWNLLMGNSAGSRLTMLLLGEEKAANLASTGRPPNPMHLMFDPEGFRPFVKDWEQTAGILLQRIQHEAALDGEGSRLDLLATELLAYPEVPDSWKEVRWGSAELPVLTVAFEKNGESLRFFTAITTIGTPLDITVQELRLETLFPADEATDAAMKGLADQQAAC